MLLSSDLDVRNDERLQREFDKVVEAVHELEMAALKQGDGFQEQRSEPAPIDEANDITFPVDANVRAKAEAEIKTTKSDLPPGDERPGLRCSSSISPARAARRRWSTRGNAPGRHRATDRARRRGRRRAAGPDLPGAGFRVRLPAAGA